MFHLLARVCVIGDSDVGKSAILIRLIENRFEWGMTYFTKSLPAEKMVTLEDATVKLHISEIPGSFSTESTVQHSIRTTSAIVLVCDATKRETFTCLPTWLMYARKLASLDTDIYLVFNKFDLEGYDKISFSELEKFANDNNLLGSNGSVGFTAVSAKDNFNIDNLFSAIAEKSHERFKVMDKKTDASANDQPIQAGPLSYVPNRSSKKTATAEEIKELTVDEYIETLEDRLYEGIGYTKTQKLTAATFIRDFKKFEAHEGVYNDAYLTGFRNDKRGPLCEGRLSRVFETMLFSESPERQMSSNLEILKIFRKEYALGLIGEYLKVRKGLFDRIRFVFSGLMPLKQAAALDIEQALLGKIALSEVWSTHEEALAKGDRLTQLLKKFEDLGCFPGSVTLSNQSGASV